MIKRDLNRKPIYEYRCDERLKPKPDGSTRLTYSGFVYYESIKREGRDRDEVNRREVCECLGRLSHLNLTLTLHTRKLLVC